MKKDKYNKDFRPGLPQIEKQEREQHKQKGLAKKAKKQARKADAALKEVVFGSGKIIANGKPLGEVKDVRFRMKDRKFEEEYMNEPFIGVDYGADYASMEKRIMAEEAEKLDRIEPESGLNRMRLLPPREEDDFASAVNFLFQAIARSQRVPQPRPFTEVVKEFEGLMENHERLMSHFKL